MVTASAVVLFRAMKLALAPGCPFVLTPVNAPSTLPDNCPSAFPAEGPHPCVPTGTLGLPRGAYTPPYRGASSCRCVTPRLLRRAGPQSLAGTGHHRPLARVPSETRGELAKVHVTGRGTVLPVKIRFLCASAKPITVILSMK